MDGRSRLLGLCALAIGAAVVGLWSGYAARKTAVAAEANKPDQVTVIPGTSSPGNATIDYRNAQPLPLPSANWPGPDNRAPVEPRPTDTGGTSSPGGRGSGEQHMKIIPR
jgi:hypothetical protein